MGIQISTPEEIDQNFVNQIRFWTNEVFEIVEFPPPCLCLTIWKTMEKFEAFCRDEKQALGIVTGEESDFLATHDAWRGYPRIHVCQERLKTIPSAVVRGVIHHEIGHALNHGSPEYYTFRFSNRLQEAGLACGMDMPLLQQSVYLLSVAIKDQEVVQWLAKMGLGFHQLVLLKHLISDTEDEHQIWKLVKDSAALQKIAFSAFLKTLLPVEAMIVAGIEDASALKNQWNEAYGWLSEKERNDLFDLARHLMKPEGKTFQDRLEEAVFTLLTEITELSL